MPSLEMTVKLLLLSWEWQLNILALLMATYKKCFGVVPYNHTFSHSKHLKRTSVAQEAAMETYWHLMSLQKTLCWDQHGYLQRDWMPIRNFLCHDTPSLCIQWNTWRIFFSDCTQAIHPAPTQMPIFISKVMESWLRLDFLIPLHHAVEGTEN